MGSEHTITKKGAAIAAERAKQEIKKMLVDIHGLAQELYRVMDEDARALMAFGMIDKKYIDSLERNTRARLDEIARENDLRFDVTKKESFISEIVGDVSKELYNVADMVV